MVSCCLLDGKHHVPLTRSVASHTLGNRRMTAGPILESLYASTDR
jgi:hypothetical protein